MTTYDLISIGGGPGGLIAARHSRKLNPKWQIGLFRNVSESVVPCSLPYALDGTIKQKDYLKDDKVILGKVNIDLISENVVDINPTKKTITSDNGNSYKYKKLVLSTGSSPALPSLKGSKLKNVFTIKGHQDITNLIKALKKIKTATIVGAGFIGLEFAEVLNNKGIKVNVVDKESCCLPNNFSQDYSEIATKQIEKLGIKFHKNISIKSIAGKKKVEAVILSNGKKIASELVIFSVGVKPETALGKTAKLKMGYYGIKTDKTMRTSNKDIYALGDCVESTDFLTRTPTSSFLATTASAQAKVAAINISGGVRNFPGVVSPAITKIGDLSFGSVGINGEKALDLRIEVLIGNAQGFTREKVYKGAEILKTRLIARKKDLRIIGAEVVSGECVGYIINMLTLAILNKNTARDLAELQFSGHPPQIDVPSNMHIIAAAEQILEQESCPIQNEPKNKSVSNINEPENRLIALFGQ